MLFISGLIDTHSVLKTLFDIILLVRKEDTDPRPSLIKDRDDERNLDFIA